jgi:probable rRNA maturation factor
LNRRAPQCGPPVLFLECGTKSITAKGRRFRKDGRKKTPEEESLVILRKPVAGLSDTALSKFVARASRAGKLKGKVNVLVTGSSELRSLNRRFRSKDQPTDVLSFPPGPCFVNGLAGDIAISADIAGQNARRLGHSAAQEIKILVLHGVLHLAGYDHERDDGLMAGREAQLRRSLGLPLGLIERNGKMRKGPKRVQGKAAGGGARATQSTRTR